jgi:hypothetical protein
MSPRSESARTRRHSLGRAMAVIVVIAADLAALRPFFPLQLSILWTSYPWSVLRAALPPNFPNLGLAVTILVLEIGLFRLASRQGAGRMFWLGFEVAGWACVIIGSAFATTIWWRLRSLFEGSLIGREIGRPSDMGRFVLFVGGLHLSISLAIALLAGILTRSAWRRRGHRGANGDEPGHH